MLPEISPRVAVLAAALSADPRVATRSARSLGFGGLMFDAVSPSFDATELSQTGRREFGHVLSSQGLQLSGLRYDVGSAGLRPEVDLDQLLWHLGKAMEAAAGLRAPVVSVELGALPEPAAVAPPKREVDEAMLGLIILPPKIDAPAPPPTQPTAADSAFEASVDNALAAIAARCDQVGITLAFRSELSSLAALDRAVRGARCPWFGIDLDPVALLHDRWSSDEAFSAFGGIVRHVRGRDAVTGGVGQSNRSKPMPIGRGGTDWRALLSDLDAAGYHGFFTVDPLELPDRTAGARMGKSHLDQLMR